MLLAEGEHISADGRLVQEADLRVGQATLMGESHPARMTAEVVLHRSITRVELPNLVFAGTSVAAGTGTSVVFATGMSSEFGTIAHLTQAVGEALSPLQQEMVYTTNKVVTMIAVGVGLLFFVLAVALAGVTLAARVAFVPLVSLWPLCQKGCSPPSPWRWP